MIPHIIFFKFKADATEAAIADLEASLNGLPGLIAEIRAFSCGRDVLRSARSYHLALIADFDDLAALDRYQVHPDHQAVVAKVKVLAESVIAVDFEC